MFRSNYLFYLFMAMLVVSLGCGEKIPSKELVKAKSQIAKAQSVKAEKYAPVELDAASKKLFEAHDYVKAGDLEKAKKSAEESAVKGNEAYEKSMPLLAKDTIDIADQSLLSAKEVSADTLAATDFAKASDQLNAAKKYYDEKKYYDSYMAALEADKLAKNSRNVSLGQKDILRDAIEDVKYTLMKAKKFNAEKYSAEKYNLASEHVQKAGGSYEANKLKDGFSEAEVAKLNADQAYLEALEASAKDRLAQADAAILKAEKSKNAIKAKDEIAAAKEARDNARSLLEEKKFEDSIRYADESLKHSSYVLGAYIADATVKDKGEAGEETLEKKEKPAKETGVSGIIADTASKYSQKEDEDYYYYRVIYRKKYPDCLWYISYRYYKNYKLWPKIYNANKDLIKNPDLIQPGWVIRVPKK